MSDRKTITVTAEAYEALAADKDGSWSEYLLKLHDDDANSDECISPGDIADIGAEVERRLEKTLDNRLTRR